MAFIILILSLLCNLLETIVLPAIGGNGFKVDLVLLFWLFTMYIVLRSSEQKKSSFDIVFPIFLSGIVFDFLTTETIGLHALLFLFSCAVGYLLMKKIPFQNIFFLLPFCIIIVSLVFNVLYFSFYISKGTALSFSFIDFLWRSVAANLIAGLLVYPTVTFIYGRLSFKDEVELKA